MSDEDIYEDYDMNDYDDSNDYEKKESVLNYEVDPLQEDIKFYKQDQLLKEREKLIDEASTNLCLSKEESTLALMYYKWSIENLNEDWFNNIENSKKLSGIIPDTNSQTFMKINNIPSDSNYCLICAESNIKLVSLSCNHKFCEDCWKEYLNEKSKVFTCLLDATCPQEGCSCKVFESFYMKYLTDEESISRIKKGIIKNYIENNKEIRYCPNPKCDYCIQSIYSNKDVTCLCKTSFCFKCNKESHRPCSCEMYEKWMKKMSGTTNDDEIWIKANTKECFYCHQRIEKKDGCNYMLCDKKAGGCGHAFCYVCGTDWTKHSQDHFNCNKYTEEVKNSEKEADKLKQYLKRYEFYSKRYFNYLNSSKICDNKLRTTLNKEIQILNSEKSICLFDLEFIIDGLNEVIDGKKSLSKTYIFGYYLKNGQNKNFFEFSQGLLERNADELNKLLEYGEIETLITTNDAEQFNNLFISFKNKVINLKNSILEYKKKLLLEIENKYLDDIDMDIYNTD